MNETELSRCPHIFGPFNRWWSTDGTIALCMLDKIVMCGRCNTEHLKDCGKHE